MAIQLINQETGEIDGGNVVEVTLLRAQREFGGPNPPASYTVPARQWVMDRARAERLQWRQHRGLPDESPSHRASAWATCGDIYGRL